VLIVSKYATLGYKVQIYFRVGLWDNMRTEDLMRKISAQL
jgi:hypothetical protein